MDVALAADGDRVAQAFRHELHRGDRPLLAGVRRRRRADLDQRSRGQNRAGPRAKILGREILAGNLAEIIVDVGRVDRVGLALVVEILKQFLPRQLAAPFDEPGQPLVGQLDAPHLSRLAAEVKANRRPANLGVLIVQRGEAVGAIGARVFFVTHADQRVLEQEHDDRQDFVARQPRQLEIAAHPPAHPRQGGPERQHPPVFFLIANFPPPRVVAVLLAATGVATGRLQVTVGERTDPNVAPRRRDHQAVNPGERLGVAHGATVNADESKSAPRSLPTNPGQRIADVPQVHRLRIGNRRLDCRFSP